MRFRRPIAWFRVRCLAVYFAVPSNDVLARLAGAFGVKPEHFREYRIRVITDRLEQMPDLVDRLYKKLG